MSVTITINHLLLNVIDYTAICVTFLLDFFRPTLRSIIKNVFSMHGIQINGSNPWDVQVHDEKFYAMVIVKGLSGFVESFIEGHIDCEDLDEFFYRCIKPRNGFLLAINFYHPYVKAKTLTNKFFDAQTPDNTYNTVGGHYDVDVNAFKRSLDSTLQYSTMIFESEKSLDTETDEQLVKVMDDATYRMRELIGRKLKLEPGMRVLDLGCGYGGLAKYLAEKYKVHVTGVTISHNMAKHATEVCKGLDVKIHRMDYRGIKGKFDRVVSVEMFEHLGEHNHRQFFENVDKWLVDDGIFVLNTISVNHSTMSSYDPMIEYATNFYHWMPRPEDIVKHSKGLFIIEDWQNFGVNLGLTAKASFKRIRFNWAEYEQTSSKEELRKILTYVSLAVATGRARKCQMYSVVFSKNGIPYQYSY